MTTDDACTLLDQDHIKVERLFTQYKAAHEVPHKRVLSQQICQELTVHTQIEEEIFYPAYARATGDEQLVAHSTKEHAEAKQLIAKIEQAQVSDKLMLELEDAILHHVQDEREKMFPKARKALNLDLTQLARQLEARKSELMAAA